jgi:hypothetical protein
MSPLLYYLLDKSSYPSVDSFTVIGSTLYMLQMTVGQKHSAVSNTICDIIRKVQTDCARVDTFVLAFVVPQDVYDAFTFQQWSSVRDTDQALIAQCQQWVLKGVV